MREEGDDRPPFGGSWGVLYACVLLFLLLEIAVFAVFTRVYA